MPTNQGFTFTFNSTSGTQVPLYPETTKEQVEGWNVGEVYGPYQLTLSARNWANKIQTIALSGIKETDVPICVKRLVGSSDEMKAQDQAYSLLDTQYGITSSNGAVKFTCTDAVPDIDIKVQVSWTR